MASLAMDFDLSVDADLEMILEEIVRFANNELEGLRGEDDMAVRSAETRIKELGLDNLSEYPPLLTALVTEELARGSIRLAAKVGGSLFARRCLLDAPASIRSRLEDVSSDPRLVCGRSIRDRQGDPQFRERVMLSVPDSDAGTWLVGVSSDERTETDFVPLRFEEELAWAEHTYRMHVVFWASLIVGAMRRGLETAINHARTRRSFGKPLVQHQAVAIRIADMCLALDGCKLLTWQMARSSGGAETRSSDAADGISETAAHFASDLVQMFGAHGYVAGGTANRIYKELHVAARHLGA